MITNGEYCLFYSQDYIYTIHSWLNAPYHNGTLTYSVAVVLATSNMHLDERRGGRASPLLSTLFAYNYSP